MKGVVHLKSRIISLISAAALLTSCGTAQSASYDRDADDSLKVVCTAFAYYDWTRNIAEGSGTEITYLLSDGVDMHSFQPTARDLAAVLECDVLIYGGGESEQLLTDACNNSPDENRIVLPLLDDDALAEEIVEGMQSEEESDDEDETESDEHIWLSPKRAALCCEKIEKALTEADGAHAELYRSNDESYIGRLDVLDKKCSSAAGGTIIVADRFPFLYLARDYGIDYYAAFPGCSAESEASFETVSFLTGKCSETDAKTIYIIDGSDGKLANTVAGGCENAPEIKELDSMQSVSASEIESGADYIGIMEKNIGILSGADASNG